MVSRPHERHAGRRNANDYRVSRSNLRGQRGFGKRPCGASNTVRLRYFRDGLRLAGRSPSLRARPRGPFGRGALRRGRRRGSHRARGALDRNARVLRLASDDPAKPPCERRVSRLRSRFEVRRATLAKSLEGGRFARRKACRTHGNGRDLSGIFLRSTHGGKPYRRNSDAARAPVSRETCNTLSHKFSQDRRGASCNRIVSALHILP